ncbi:hypothetical protein CFOL_v3_19003 [Cephalotus follicularis]|uniref:Retropepsins domain-containing protein n=1 Tax=Cephalotus follicularis TaxID=3775 RepID=A0A1Q3C5Q7_CEPFO|nr:hypothetical protein CFOL_v3_19003 [Cephalotus follicularis]
MNCIQERLIPTKYFEKTKQKLSTANGENLRVNFKITNVHICNEGICIKQSFILVKDLDIGIILGQPFLKIIKPFKVKTEGITTKIFQQKILFAFNEKPITKDINLLKTFSLFKEHSINLIKTKENHLYFMKQEVSNKKLEQHLPTSQISLKNNIINNLCSDLPNAFWHRKRHMVSLPYEKDFTEQNIPMTYELMEHCKKEIQELLNKNLDTSRLIIDYKPLKNFRHLHIVRHPVPNKKDLLKKLTESDSTIPFKHHEWNVMSFDTTSKIMNDIFIPYSSFSKINIENILTISKEQNFKYLYTFYKKIQTNNLVLSKLELDLFNTHVETITISQKSILFAQKISDIVTDKKQLPTSSFIICFNIDSLFINPNQECQQASSTLQEKMESIKDTLFPTETKKIMSDTLSSTKERIRFLQKNETFEKRLQTLYVFEKILVCDTTIICSMRIKTLCVNIPFTDKLLFNNTNHTHPNPYKKSSFFHSFKKM